MLITEQQQHTTLFASLTIHQYLTSHHYMINKISDYIHLNTLKIWHMHMHTITVELPPQLWNTHQNTAL